MNENAHRARRAVADLDEVYELEPQADRPRRSSAAGFSKRIVALTVTGAVRSGAAAYAMAGLKPADIDVVQVYDAFTITTLLFLEDLGFCPKGEGGRFVADGAIAPGGRLPVNTSGGGLSYCHPGMFGIFVLIEAVRQLRGEAGLRQVAGCDTAIAHGNGGTLSAQSTVILGTQATL